MDRDMVKLIIDRREIETPEGTILLKACLDNGIYIPNLCYLEGMDHPPASCRLCFVEVEGDKGGVLTSCTVRVRNGMVVRTDSPSVRRIQRGGLRLLLSVHHVACAECPANKRCELQRMAEFLKVGLRPKQLDHLVKEPEIDRSHPLLDHYPNRCVLCGRCLAVCQELHDRPFLTFAKRGFDTVISLYGEKEETERHCAPCFACVETCPVAAITPKPGCDAVASRPGQDR